MDWVALLETSWRKATMCDAFPRLQVQELLIVRLGLVIPILFSHDKYPLGCCHHHVSFCFDQNCYGACHGDNSSHSSSSFGEISDYVLASLSGRHVDDWVATYHECEGEILFSNRNMAHIHFSIIVDLSSTSSAKLSTTPKHVWACKSPISIICGMNPMTDIPCFISFWSFSIASCWTLVLHYGCKSMSLPWINPSPESTRQVGGMRKLLARHWYSLYMCWEWYQFFGQYLESDFCSLSIGRSFCITMFVCSEQWSAKGVPVSYWLSM